MIKNYLVRILTKTVDSSVTFKCWSIDEAIDNAIEHVAKIYHEELRSVEIKIIGGIQ